VTHDPRQILAAKKKRERLPRILDAMYEELFDEQRALADDPSKRIANYAGRRSGKTSPYPFLALRAAVNHPGSTVVIVETAITCDAAERAWAYFMEADERHKIGWKVHATYKRLVLPAPYHSTIEFRGAATLEGCNSLRGNKFSAILVDEPASFRKHILKYLLTDVVPAALMDYDGSCYLTGSPGAVLEGPFYDACMGKGGWSPHTWTVIQNPHVGPAKLDPEARRAWRIEYLRQERERQGWNELTPTYRREWLGEWVSADNDLMYAFMRERNVCREAIRYNPDTWRVVIGCDVGYNAPSAFVVLGLKPNDPHIYVLESYEKVGLIPSAWAQEVRALRTRYSTSTIVVDSGGLGKGYIEEGIQTFRLPLLAANKRRKVAFVEFASGDLASGRIQVIPETNLDLMADLETLPWNDDHTDSAPRFRDHLPDAFLYAHRQLAAPDDIEAEPDAPQKFSDAWWAAEEARMEEWALNQQLMKMGELDEEDLDDD
jgi:hypothetical protein